MTLAGWGWGVVGTGVLDCFTMERIKWWSIEIIYMEVKHMKYHMCEWQMKDLMHERPFHPQFMYVIFQIFHFCLFSRHKYTMNSHDDQHPAFL